MTDAERKMWAEIPYQKRYSEFATASRWLVKAMRKVDPWLDLKFYLPTQTWHVVRYPHGFSYGKFTKVWECGEDPVRGLRGGPGEWIIDAMKAGDMRKRRGEIERLLKESDERMERDALRQQEDAALEAAKDMRKPLQALEDYGPNSDYHEVY